MESFIFKMKKKMISDRTLQALLFLMECPVLERVSMDLEESEMGEQYKNMMSKKWCQNVFDFAWALSALFLL
jgi:hypothetical protein